MERLKVLVVEKSVVFRKFITEAVNGTEHGAVERTASDANIALEWLKQSQIDVVLLDIQDLNKSGIKVLEAIETGYPETEVIVMGHEDMKSVKSGAVDFIVRPSEKDLEKTAAIIKNQLQAIFAQIKVKKFSPAAERKNIEETDAAKALEAPDRERRIQTVQAGWKPGLILIASSTGGPIALDTVCRQLPTDFRTPVLVVQHMPPDFTGILANTLSSKYLLDVREGRDGDRIKEGRIIIAPGGKHMIVESADGFGKVIRLLDTPYVNGVRPAADILFSSVAKAYKGSNILAVILTGMGNDGTKGIMELKRECNCYCITQSEKTCVVYGMPKCVHEAGMSDEVADLNDIASRILQLARDREVRP